MCRINNYVYFMNILFVKMYISVLSNVIYITQSCTKLEWLNPYSANVENMVSSY